MQVEDELELARALYRQIGRLLAFEYAADIGTDDAPIVRLVGPVAHQLCQKAEPLCVKLAVQSGDPGDVSARPVEAGDEAVFHRVERFGLAAMAKGRAADIEL